MPTIVSAYILGFTFALSSFAFAQEETERTQITLDKTPFVSARASGMGNAISTFADGPEAIYFNPAGIGGFHWEKTKPPSIRQFHFPYVGASENKNAGELRKEFSTQGGAEDRSIGNAIVDASVGDQQYARASFLMDFVYKRMMLATYSDTQFGVRRLEDDLVTDEEANAERPGNIELRYKSLSGSGIGFSFVDVKETFYLGVFGSSITLGEMVNDVNYLEIINTDDRSKVLKNNEIKWTGFTMNAGILWKFARMWRPALAVVAKDAGGSKLKLKSAPQSYTGEKTKIIQQDITVGFSISPQISKNGTFNYVLEAHNLSDDQVAVSKKFRTALEYTYGGFGGRSSLGIRAGYNLAGASYGLNLNLGLINFEVASEAVDIGVGNQAILDRRNVAVFSVNVLDN